MNRIKVTTRLMIFLGIVDLVIVPLMVHQNSVSKHGTPPVPAIVLQVVIAILTLVASIGIPTGKRWARRTGITMRVLDALSSLLGVTAPVSGALKAGGAVLLVLSVLAIILVAGTSRMTGAPSRLAV